MKTQKTMIIQFHDEYRYMTAEEREALFEIQLESGMLEAAETWDVWRTDREVVSKNDLRKPWTPSCK